MAETLEVDFTTKRDVRFTEQIVHEHVAQHEPSIVEWEALPFAEKPATPRGINAP